MLVATIIHIFISLYIMLLVLRMFVSERDAYFNALFKAAYQATEPAMAPIRQLRKGPRDTDKPDLTVFIPILLLVIVDGILTGVFAPGFGLFGGVMARVIGFINAVFLVFVVLILIFSVFYKYSRFPSNPFLRVAFKIMEPLYVAVGKMGVFFREHSGIFLFIFGFLAHLIVISGLIILVQPESLASPVILAAIIVRASLLNLLLLAMFFSYVIIVAALMSWISPDPRNPVVQVITLMSEPINRPFRKFIPLIGGIDISPIFSILTLQVIAQAGSRLVIALTSPAGKVVMP